MTAPAGTVDPGRARGPRVRALVAGVVLTSVLAGLGVGLWTATNEPTSATVRVVLDPVAIEELYTFPGIERDVGADLAAAARSFFASAPAEAAAERAAGRQVRLTVEPGDPERGEIVITADAGDRFASADAATAAATTFVEQRSAVARAAVEGGIVSVGLSLDELEAEAARIVDAEQRAVHDQLVFDRRASLAQLEQALQRLDDRPVGFPDEAEVAADGSSFHEVGSTVALVVLVVGLAAVWAHVRWAGVVTARRGVVGAEVSVLQLASGSDAAAFVRGALLLDRGGSAPVVLLAPAAGEDAWAVSHLAERLAESVGQDRTAALVDLDPSGSGPESPAADDDEAAVGAGGAGSRRLTGGSLALDGEASVATSSTGRQVERLASQVDIVVLVATQPPTSSSTVAWSAHADELDLVVVEDRTLQGEVRRSLVAWARAATSRNPRVLLLSGDAVSWTPGSVEVPAPGG